LHAAILPAASILRPGRQRLRQEFPMFERGLSQVVVTGGAGWIGSHLCSRLLPCWHAVRAVDDLGSGRSAHPGSAGRMQRIVSRPLPALVAGRRLAARSAPSLRTVS
jgi:nucleoside-diphosphate-sugar epimerase